VPRDGRQIAWFTRELLVGQPGKGRRLDPVGINAEFLCCGDRDGRQEGCKPLHQVQVAGATAKYQ
jgi:hypothetical protein